MKKLFALVLAILVTFSLTACIDTNKIIGEIGNKLVDAIGNNSNDTNNADSNTDDGNPETNADNDNTEGSNSINDDSGLNTTEGGTFESEDGTYSFGGEWPENEFTELIPKPDFGTLYGSATADTYFLVYMSDVDEAKLREYIETVKGKGFTQNAETVDENFLGLVVVSYYAENDNGYKLTIGYTLNILTITIEKG